jgi:hypothetical protein
MGGDHCEWNTSNQIRALIRQKWEDYFQNLEDNTTIQYARHLEEIQGSFQLSPGFDV